MTIGQQKIILIRFHNIHGPQQNPINFIKNN